jgi:hypothetical protein
MPDAQAPDRLAAAMRLPLDLADTAETGVPAARAIVRRIDATLVQFIARWRELLSLEDANAATQLGVRGRDISALFETSTDRLHAELRRLRGDASDLGARLDLLLGVTIVFVVVLSIIAARAIWRLFTEQRDRAGREAKRRKGLEAALAQLDAAIRARRADGTQEVTLRLPDPLPPPPVAPAAVTAPETQAAPPDLPSKEKAKETGPIEMPKRRPMPKRPARDKDPEPAAAAVPAAEPDTDELIKMLMTTLGPPPDANKK